LDGNFRRNSSDGYTSSWMEIPKEILQADKQLTRLFKKLVKKIK
jgi:hypothetical protein